jgi:hypothetical protein
LLHFDGARVLSRLACVLGLAFLTLPLLIALAWGPYLDDSAYVTFRYAGDLAWGRAWSPRQIEGQALLRAPLYAVALALPASLGFPLPETSLVLSALGWIAAVLALYSCCRTLQRPVAAVMVIGGAMFSPLIVSTLGTAVSWTVALAWVAFMATLGRRWQIQTWALLLMVGTYCDVDVLLIAVGLSIVRWRVQGRLPLRLLLMLALLALGGTLLAHGYFVAPFSMPRISLAAWWRVLDSLLAESEFYGVAWAFAGLGLLAAPRSIKLAAAAGAVFLFWGPSPLANAMLGSLVLFLTALGMAWCVNWGVARAFSFAHAGSNDLSRFLPWIAGSRFHVRRNDFSRFLSWLVGGMLLVGLLPGIAQVSSLSHRYRFRPVVFQDLEAQAANWLHQHSQPTATVLSTARVGYVADRVTWSWSGHVTQEHALMKLVGAWNLSTPAYCVSFRSIAWDHVTRTGWFQDLYVPLRTFRSPYDARSPLTVWGARTRDVAFGPLQPLDIRLPRDMKLVGYTYAPKRIQPGQAVYATLFMQATRPLTSAFRSVVEVISPYDGIGWAHRDQITPRSVPVSWWRPGQVLAERFVLTTTEDIRIGAHHLDLFMVTNDSRTILPLYHGAGSSLGERLTLGYVTVPWRGTVQEAQPVGARVGDAIRLLGYEAVADPLSPGAAFDVMLYWEAVGHPAGHYIVFVHLLNAEGEFVAGHDGPPFDGRYPTQAWLPGDVVPDRHPLILDPAVPPGAYRLQVGMYQWPSLERLPVWDRQGEVQPEHAVVLQWVTVSSE